MGHEQSPAPESGAQVIRLRRPGGSKPPAPRRGYTAAGEPPDDLAKYSRDETPDDYRHRMIMNAAALAFVALLAAAGLWLADTMASMRKNQDLCFDGPARLLPG